MNSWSRCKADSLGEVSRELDQVSRRLSQTKRRNKELNNKLMKTLAELSDAQDTIKRWQVELEIVASKTSPNLCHIWIPDLLKRTLGHTGEFPDSEGMTEEEFRQGCDEYRKCIFAAIRANKKPSK